MRNVGAFINFRCDPNLVVRPLKSYFDPDGRWCRFGFFAKKDIKEGDEVGYLRDPGATTRRKYSEKKCLCGLSAAPPSEARSSAAAGCDAPRVWRHKAPVGASSGRVARGFFRCMTVLSSGRVQGRRLVA